MSRKRRAQRIARVERMARDVSDMDRDFYATCDPVRSIIHDPSRLRSNHNPLYARGRSVWIYAISDPRDRVIRYVGKTSCSLASRLKGHIKNPTSRAMRDWLDGLRMEGVVPKISPLERCWQKNWQSREQAWIRRFGSTLLNVLTGGEGKMSRVISKPDTDTVARSGPVRRFTREEIAAMNARLRGAT